ncbi:response regulator [Cohnella sp. GCM10012308]|uniref:response regulator transcription factor n=1 Tax=Cohnella sp. GCM10012308 TaxID=3317329 RepID=UPI00360E558B
MFRMIIVEDEPRILRNLKEKVKSLGPDFKVVGAYNNGEDALVELHWTQPHVLLTDIRMPVMNGLELIAQVKAKLPDVQFAVLSGHHDFQYLREAIQLGVTDYLLKPATDEDIGSLLGKLKEKLLLNQSLLEREIARQLLESAQEPDMPGLSWKEIAQELFYHGNYIVAYAWSPLGDLPAGLEAACSPLLREGENRIPLPSAAGNEHISLFGVHSLSPERRNEWTQALTERLQNEQGITVLLAVSVKGIQPVPALLAECKKLALTASRFPASCQWTRDVAPEETGPILEQLQPALSRMAPFIVKHQRQLFVKELESLFQPGRALPKTRKGWEELLLYASHSLHGLQSDAFKTEFAGKQAMESELREEVWRAKGPAELLVQVKEIWSAYFFKVDPDQASARDWAEEAKSYMEGHFHENISLTAIAESFQLHPAYLNRVFKRAYRLSIPDYLLHLRMEEACRFMKAHPFVLIKEIAEHVGYSDPFYFSKVFKQHTGASPSDYRSGKP